MSIQTEVTRIQDARDLLCAKAVELKISAGTERLLELAEDYNGIVNHGSITQQVKEGETFTIPKGYHDGTGTVSGVAGGGDYGLQSKTVTPTTKPQQVTPDEGFYGLSDVSVEAIPSQYQDVSPVTATSTDVLTGKILVTAAGAVVPGEMPNNGAVNKIIDAVTTSVTIAEGYHNGQGTVSLVPENKSVTPTKESQNILPTGGKVLTNVTVAAIPANFIDTTDATATDTDILSGKTAYVNGAKLTGSIPNNGALNGEINGLTETSYTIPVGYTTGGTVSLTNDIEAALAQI